MHANGIIFGSHDILLIVQSVKLMSSNFHLQAEPTMKQFTDGQLKPAAQAIADGAMPAAKTVTEGYIQPTADAIATKVSMIRRKKK